MDRRGARATDEALGGDSSGLDLDRATEFANGRAELGHATGKGSIRATQVRARDRHVGPETAPFPERDPHDQPLTQHGIDLGVHMRRAFRRSTGCVTVDDPPRDRDVPVEQPPDRVEQQPSEEVATSISDPESEPIWTGRFSGSRATNPR